jgi:hypothetical protein
MSDEDKYCEDPLCRWDTERLTAENSVLVHPLIEPTGGVLASGTGNIPAEQTWTIHRKCFNASCHSHVGGSPTRGTSA